MTQYENQHSRNLREAANYIEGLKRDRAEAERKLDAYRRIFRRVSKLAARAKAEPFRGRDGDYYEVILVSDLPRACRANRP